MLSFDLPVGLAFFDKPKGQLISIPVVVTDTPILTAIARLHAQVDRLWVV